MFHIFLLSQNVVMEWEITPFPSFPVSNALNCHAFRNVTAKSALQTGSTRERNYEQSQELHWTLPIQKSLTLSCLRLDKRFDESVRGLSVEGESISKWLQVWTLLQEGFLQTVPTSMEILLRVKRNGKGTEQELQPATNIYVQLCVRIGNSWKNSQNSFCTGNPPLRPADTNCSWHSCSKALKYEYADSQHASPLNLFRCTQTWQYSLRAFITVAAGTDSCHLLNWDRHCPPKKYLGMELGNSRDRNGTTYFDCIQCQIQDGTLLWSEAPGFFSHHMILQTTIVFDMSLLSEAKGKGVPSITTFSGFTLYLCGDSINSAVRGMFNGVSQSHLLQLNLKINSFSLFLAGTEDINKERTGQR